MQYNYNVKKQALLNLKKPVTNINNLGILKKTALELNKRNQKYNKIKSNIYFRVKG